MAKIRVTIDPEYRGRGIARTLVREFIDLCGPLKIAILQAEVLDIQDKACALFEGIGFQAVATLTQHAIDLAGRVHDIRMYTYTVSQPEALAPEASWLEADADIGGG